MFDASRTCPFHCGWFVANSVWDNGTHTICAKSSCVVLMAREMTVLEFWCRLVHKTGSPAVNCESISSVLRRYRRCGDWPKIDHHNHRLFILGCLIFFSFTYTIISSKVWPMSSAVGRNQTEAHCPNISVLTAWNIWAKGDTVQI